MDQHDSADCPGPHAAMGRLAGGSRPEANLADRAKHHLPNTLTP
jgi:hypothetical protein